MESLGKFVNRWIEEELPRKTHAKCLILIGRPNSGKCIEEEVERSHSHLKFREIMILLRLLFNNNHKRKNSLCRISAEVEQLL